MLFHRGRDLVLGFIFSIFSSGHSRRKKSKLHREVIQKRIDSHVEEAMPRGWSKFINPLHSPFIRTHPSSQLRFTQRQDIARASFPMEGYGGSHLTDDYKGKFWVSGDSQHECKGLNMVWGHEVVWKKISFMLWKYIYREILWNTQLRKLVLFVAIVSLFFCLGLWMKLPLDRQV